MDGRQEAQKSQVPYPLPGNYSYKAEMKFEPRKFGSEFMFLSNKDFSSNHPTNGLSKHQRTSSPH